MLKAVIALVVALLLAVSAALWQYDRAQEYKDSATAANTALAASQARLATLQSNLRKLEKANATRNRELDEANSGRDPVATPPAVYNVLCQRGNCRKLDPVRTPGD